MTTTSGRPSGLIGRENEQAAIAGLLDAVDRKGAALLIDGAPGVGKSALLEWAADTAGARLRVTRAVGSPAEQRLPYAALHQVLRPVLPLATGITPHRRAALDIAFGRPADTPPDPFHVAIATVDVLAEAASVRPLLILVDDAHWIDHASQFVLGFVARRLEGDRVVALVTHRSGECGPLLDAMLPGLELQPLSPASAEQVLDATAGDCLDAATRAAVLELAQGNPLALRELPRSVTTSARGDRLPLTRRLENSFAERVDRLPAPVRTALEVAALSDSGELADITAALHHLLGDAAGLLDRAVATGLVEVDGTRLRFVHPLIRSCVVQRMGPEAQRSVHSSFATVLVEHSERAVWHRAAAAFAPDAAVADELAGAAARAVERGAPGNAVAALERSAQLSPSASRCDRLFHAATLAYALGQAATGDRLRGDYRQAIGSDHDRLRHEWLVELATGDRGGAHRVGVLVEAADRAHALGEDALVLQFLRAAALRCLNFGPDQPVGRAVIDAAERLVPAGDRASRAGLLAFGEPLQRAGEVLELVRAVEAVGRDATTAFELGHAAACVGAFDVSEGLFAEAVEALRVEGRLHTLGTALALLSWSALRRGRWTVAVSAADEGARLCEDTDQPFWQAYAHAAEATVLALRGNFPAAGAAIDRAETVAAPHRFVAAGAAIQVARAASAAGQGQHELAFHHLARLHRAGDDVHHQLHGLWSLAALADAAVLSGQAEAGRAVLAGLRPEVWTTSSPAVRMNVLYADAVLAAEDELEHRLDEALRADVAGWPFEHHRLRMTYGSVLRRRQRVRDSREHLRDARDGFDLLGARTWAERARDELRAAGERSRPPSVDAWDVLSPQELQIATMVALGLSNREIGERLFLSHRTVGSHLYRMFPKLGISSRVELVQMAAARDGGRP